MPNHGMERDAHSAALHSHPSCLTLGKQAEAVCTRNERVVDKYTKLLQRVVGGASDANIPFADLRKLLLHFGFDERVRGDQHILTKPGVEEILNIQPKGSKAKSYQVKQVRNVIIRYKLGGQDVE